MYEACGQFEGGYRVGKPSVSDGMISPLRHYEDLARPRIYKLRMIYRAGTMHSLYED